MSNFYHVERPHSVLKVPVTDCPRPIFENIYPYRKIEIESLTDEFIQWLELRGLLPKTFVSILLFYAFTGGKLLVHKDGWGPECWAYNVSLGNVPVLMNWHHAEGCGEATNQKETFKYDLYPEDSKIIESTYVNSTLVRVGVPHSSSHEGPPSWLMSVRCAPTRMTIEQAHYNFSAASSRKSSRL